MAQARFLIRLIVLLSLPLQLLAVRPEQLGIALNPEVASEQSMLFGSRVEIPNLHTWSAAELVHLAEVGYEGMESALSKQTTKSLMAAGVASGISGTYRDGKVKGPTVMSLLVVGDTAYFASSLKGTGMAILEKITKTRPVRYGSFTDRAKAICPDIVKNALQVCSYEDPQTGQTTNHKFGGACGEVMAVWAYCSTQPLPQGPDALAGMRVVAIERDSKTQKLQIKAPCQTDQQTNPAYDKTNPGLSMTGCYNFVFGKDVFGNAQKQGLKLLPIDPDTKPIPKEITVQLRPTQPDYLFKMKAGTASSDGTAAGPST